MGVQRNNDEERAAIVERLLQEQRRERREPVKASLRNSDGPERRVTSERRHGRSDAELRMEREALQRQWEAMQRSPRNRRGDGADRLEMKNDAKNTAKSKRQSRHDAERKSVGQRDR